MLDQIEEVVHSEIRPFLRTHQGDLKIISVEDGMVNVKLLGACSGCPQSDVTTKDFIELKLCEALPWVKGVTLSHDVDPELIDLAKQILNGKFR